MPSKPHKRTISTSRSLRQRAEALLQRTRQDVAAMSVQNVQQLVYELQVHQIELEMQNDELRCTQIALMNARDRYADLYDFAPVGYLSLAPDGIILEANFTAAQYLGVSRARLLGQSVSAFVVSDLEAQNTLHRHHQQVFIEPTPCTCDLWMQRQDGTSFYAQLKSLSRRDDITGLFCWRLAFIDLTAQRQQAEVQLRRLALHQQQLQEKERAAMAREIHDELAQTLTSLHIEMAWLSERLLTNPEAHKRLHAMITQLHDLDLAFHHMAMTLHPRLLDDLGLRAAIEWQLEEMHQRAGLPYVLQTRTDDIPLEPARATALFRIFQEALTNVVRHAQASKVLVHIVTDAQEVRLTVTDNGKGMTWAQQHDIHALGLLGMQERAQLWDGTLTITSHPGQGTTVTARMPYQAVASLRVTV